MRWARMRMGTVVAAMGCVLMGVVVSVMVAWGCSQGKLRPLANRALGPGEQARWRANAREGWPRVAGMRVMSEGFGSPYEAISAMVTFPDEAGPGQPGPWMRGIYKEWRAGWPL